MEYKAIVKEAWELTQNNKQMIRLGFISALISTIVGIVYLVYQITSFKHSSLFGGSIDYVETFNNLIAIIKTHTALSITSVAFGIIIFVAYLFVPLIINGALIDLIAKYKTGRPIKGGMAKGIMRLFEMIKIHALLSPFGLFSILTEVSFVLRLSGIQVMYVILPFFILFYLIGFVLVIIFSFADQYIILNEDSFTQSMGNSTRLVLIHFKETIFLILIMFLISIRIFINVLLILFIPLAIVSLTGYLASVTLAMIGTYIAIGIGIVLLFLASYFIGTLTVFSTAVWTLSFLKMREEEAVLEES